MIDLTVTDPTMDLGSRVLLLLADGYDGEQITDRLACTPEQAEQAAHAYASRVLHGTAPVMPSPECGVATANGWCFVHGVFHPAATS